MISTRWNYFSWKPYFRIPTRLLLFGTPTFGFAYLNSFSEMHEINTIGTKYEDRFIKFQKTGNIKYIDPDDAIFENMILSSQMTQPQGII